VLSSLCITLYTMCIMASKVITLRLPEPLYKRLQSHISESGSTQTDAIVAAIATYFGDNNQIPLAERVSKLEKRLEVLER
jgi:predicted DNA-binding protein